MEEEDIFHSPQTVSEERDEKAAAAAADEDEKRKLCLMRATVETKDPSCKEIDDLTLRRFLRARDLDVEKASAMFLKYSEWRRTFVPKGYMSESEIRDEIAQKKMFMQGRDKQGRPIAVVFASRHFAAKGGVDEFRQFLMDKISSQLLEMLKDLATATAMFVGFLQLSTFLQEYYPERLGKVYIIHVPYIFMTLWKIVAPFIDKNTRKKIVFVENKRLHATLLEDIDESQLPEVYGGKLELIPIQNG
ncbi:UNVERIFIED_CONTAM: CRAL-TRIO domain-containing protein [Sesamum angustifolium]|uniref:CRAL-TRIO domain-containing protein n=1 Tax=Sesamum angustifolium TaxID=2727405 RepID=A0AAW2IKJ1_9LAMI